VILLVPRVLSSAELSSLQTSLAGARFGDGHASAGALAREQKHVLQLERAGDAQREAGALVARALLRHPLVQAAALPQSVRHPTINRYEPGMYYGPHLDAPLMRGAQPMRADLSCTVFLCEPSEYTGGELSIADEQGRQAISAVGGVAVLYPTGAMHVVKPLVCGARLVAVTWLQSLVRSAEKRRILFELGESILALQAANVATAAVLLQLRATHDNLLRMWAEH
jgi:PKHD-type hydroxylase